MPAWERATMIDWQRGAVVVVLLVISVLIEGVAEGGLGWGEFARDAAIAIIGGIVGAVGALLVANYTLRRTIEQERRDRAEEERQRREQREEDERATRTRALRSMAVELGLNDQAIRLIQEWRGESGWPPLRCVSLDQGLAYLPTLPDDLAEAIQRTAFAIDRLNTATEGARLGTKYDPLTWEAIVKRAADAADPLIRTAALALDAHLGGNYSCIAPAKDDAPRDEGSASG